MSTVSIFRDKRNSEANLGGPALLPQAYKKLVKQHGEEPLLPGINLTHDQLFLFNYAQAYKKLVKQHGEEPLLPGINLTHDQLFFFNYAQVGFYA
ncbi:hypothetical protein MRX96_050283 [Rhipicephalus microplus]